MKTTINASLLAGVSLWALAGAAYAQGTGAAGNQVEEVVVTGSRVILNGDNMPTPVTVVTTDSLKDIRPGNIVESLNDMPVFNGSRGQNTNTGTNGAAGSPASSANAVNSINLRQLGVQRALILFDGHRAAPSTADGTVDLDTIPQMLLKRVDVVTGGVSAVYGSDAMTGVLNFITDTNFNGVKMNIQGGRSVYGDAGSIEGGIAAGDELFGGRGHIEGSFEFRTQDPIDSKFARPFGRNVYTLQGFGTAAQPYYQVSGARASNLTFGGRLVNNAVLGDSQFVAGGVVAPFTHGTRLGLAPNFSASNNCASCEIGGDGGVFNGQLRAALSMKQGFGRFDYDITDTVHAYFQAAYTANRSLATGNYTSNASYTIGTDNGFLLPQYKTAFGSAASFTMGKIFSEIPRGQSESHSRELFAVAGLQGSLGDYKWDIAFTKSFGSFNVTQNEAINQGRFFASLDSVISNGQPVCRASLTNTNYTGCVPLNPFGANAGSQAAINYFMAQQDWTTLVGMDEVAGSVSGSPIDDWAGPVTVALSGEWRKLTYKIDSDTPDPATGRADCNGIKFGCLATTTTFNGPVASVPQVGQTVAEGALEVEVPLLKDVQFAQSVDLNGAYRFASYDRAGDANTWKVGLTWTANDWLTVRGTRSRDFRAPTLDENFRATTISAPARAFGDTLPGNPDAAAGLNPFASTLNGGNPNLLPELGDTTTYGFVLKPLPGLDFSMDVFNIKISNAIFLIQGNTPAYQNACYASGGTSASNPGTSAYCQLIVRNAANSVTLWKQTFINLAELDTRGIDFEGGYRTEAFGGPLVARVLASYQPRLIYKQPGIVDYDYAGSSFGTNGLQSNPVWRFTAFLSYKPIDTVTVSLQERWRSELPKVDGAPANAAAPAVYSGSPVASVAYTSINLNYAPEMEGSPEFYFNIQNLFNTPPPQAGFWGNPTPGQFGEFAFGDDVIGRYFTIGARARF